MIKTSLIALAAAASVSLAALPAVAEDSIFGSGDQDLTKARIVAELKNDGVNVSSIEEWSGYVRAYVTLEDGRQVMRFFEPDTLQPALIGGGAVASELSY
jgi:hypothetical protein